jgi:hypothetical protein
METGLSSPSKDAAIAQPPDSRSHCTLLGRVS